MINYRAGLYSFVPTTTWLHETGMASPPLLVMLGLTLPDSRILSGIASIGLTLANIAIILPHLRQPILDNIHVVEGVLAPSKSTKEQKISSPVKFDAPQSVALSAESPALASPEPCKNEYQSPPLVCSASLKSMCTADTEPLGFSNVNSKVAPQTNLPSPAGESGDNPIPPQSNPSLDTGSSERNVSFSLLLARDSRSPIYISLPVLDEEEVAFFDTEDAPLSDSDLGDEYPVFACGQHTTPGEGSEGDQCLVSEQDIERDDRLVVLDLPSPSAQDCVRTNRDPLDVVMPVTNGKLSPSSPSPVAPDDRNPLAQLTISVALPDLPACGGPVGSAEAKPSSVTRKEIEILTRQRPESLEFIPLSVIRRYPSALGHQCVRYETFSSGHDYQASPAPLHISVNNPAILLDGTRPRTGHVTLPEGHWRAPLLTESHSAERSEGAIKTALVQPENPVELQPASLKGPSTVQEQTPLWRNLVSRQRLGVLGRAALRDRRFATQRREDDGDDGSSTSDSDSDFDSDSQYSSGSSAYESMLPHILGTDLIAAIDANSESGLNLAGPRRMKHTPLNVYEDFLISDDSAADVSMIMHNIPSNDDASDGETGARTPDCSLTYEDIQLWASEVVQKCVRQVCQNRTPAAPLSPSQASDVCAERPSGSGVSQCPLAGLHCKAGGAALREVSVQKAKELPASLRYPPAPTPALPGRKPLQVRNLRDIPEFVPRQRQMQMIKGHVEGPRRLNTRSVIDVTRDAATQVIARMESQAGLDPRRWIAGTEGRRMANMSGRHGTLGRCA